jgi:DNA-binding transcriptional regulator YiaG
MYATTHSETNNVNAIKSARIGQSAAKRLIIKHDMMKVQRLARNRVGPSGSKCGANMKRPIADRFFEKVVKSENGCHAWNGCVMPNGYGQVRHNGKTAYAHRVAYELAYGVPPDFVLHTCDNRKCVNPEHLFSGSFDDNMADMVSKERQCHGERNARHKLTATQVKAIRSEVGLQREIAARYGVTSSLISMIRSGRIWRLV